MPRCFLNVPHLGAARTYALEGYTLSELQNAVRACPVLGGKVDLTSSSFQVLDKTFEEYVNLTSEDTIPDLSKIQLRLNVGSEQQCTSTPSEQTAADSMVASMRGDEKNGLDISFDLPSCSDDDGHTFVLPNLGAMHDIIIGGSPLSSATFKRIVDALFMEMKKVTLFPTRNFYGRVTTLLLEKYPQLKDVVGSGADSWKVALRYKFKNQRRVLPSDGRVALNRAKFASRTKCSDPAGTMELQRHKEQKMAAAISKIPGEDDKSFVMHTEWLMCESRKSSPDESQIHERMDLTSHQRLAEISISSVHEAKTKYPYLMNFERFCSDFKRLTKVDPSASIAEGINRMINLAKLKLIPCTQNGMELIERAEEMSPQRLRTRHILTNAVIEILSFNVKELNNRSSLFVHEEDLSIPPTPCVVFSGRAVEDADLLHIKVDREKLFPVKNAEEGLAAVLSAYWLFNVQYDRKLYNTLVVLERLLLGLTLTTPRVVVTKFLNKVAKSVS